MAIRAQDEGRFGRSDRPRRCWAPPPLRPAVPRQLGREFVYLFAAVCAQLGWHTTPQLIVPANIRLLPQPARSPELNPAEHVWDELREKTLANRVFPALRLLENTLCGGLTHLSGDPQRVRSLTDFPYMRVTL